MLPPFVPIPFEQGAVFVGQNEDSGPVHSKFWPQAWHASRDLVVYVAEQIVCTRLEQGHVVSEYRFPIPESFKALCVFFAFDCIFIGGKGAKMKIICIDKLDFQLLEIEHPNILKKYRKSIDDFFIWNEKIYAVDNHIHPKYLLGYTRKANKWTCVDRVKLKGHSPEERVRGGLMWGDTLVLLSRSAHRAGITTYVSLYPNLVFERFLCWHKTLGSVGITDIVQVRVVEDQLMLITNVGVFMLSRGGQESDVRCISSQKYLIDVYPYRDKPWIGIVSKFGKKKKIALQ